MLNIFAHSHPRNCSKPPAPSQAVSETWVLFVQILIYLVFISNCLQFSLMYKLEICFFKAVYASSSLLRHPSVLLATPLTYCFRYLLLTIIAKQISLWGIILPSPSKSAGQHTAVSNLSGSIHIPQLLTHVISEQGTVAGVLRGKI